MACVARMSVPRALGVAGGLPQRKVSQRPMARRPAPVRVAKWRVAAGGGKGFGGSDDSEAATSTPAPATTQSVQSEEPRLAFEPGNKRKAKINAPVVDSLTGDKPLSADQQTETNFVFALLIVFSLLFFMGVFISISGFLSPEMDAIATDVVYPAFSPMLGVFLVLSSAYGLYKAQKGEM